MPKILTFRDPAGKQYEIGIEHSSALGHWYLAIGSIAGTVKSTEIPPPRYATELGALSAARRYAEFHGWSKADYEH